VERLSNFFTRSITMSTIKTLIRFVWFFILLAVVVGFSGWVLLAIPVAGALIDPSPQHAMLWQNLMGVCAVWIGTVACCAAVGAMLIFCSMVELIAWGYSRKQAPGKRITSDDLLKFPTREQWAGSFHVVAAASLIVLIIAMVICTVNPAWQWSQATLICSTLFFYMMMSGELLAISISARRAKQQQEQS
jgi:hypothetical protein